jgi:quercetin dioxygenase-like cupin family protein
MKIWKKYKSQKILEKFISDKDDELIKYESLKELPYNISLSIIPEQPEKIITLKINNKEEDSLTFRVTMQKGSEWSTHKHDCKETIIVYKGCLEDNIKKGEIKRGGYLIVPPYKKHSIKALEDSTFYVEFEKPKK